MAAGDKHSKTEKPTGKRKKEARGKGTIPKTPELTAWGNLLVITFLMPKIFGIAQHRMMSLLHSMQIAIANPTIPGAIKVFGIGMQAVFATIAPLMLIVLVIGVVGNIAQVGFLFTTTPLKPKWERLNPTKGFKRIFSPQGLWELLKQALKLSLFAFLAFRVLKDTAMHLASGSSVNLTHLLGSLARTSLIFLRYVAVLGLVLGFIDYAIARKRVGKSLMMTKEEVKEENKQSEGNPAVKRELRKRQAEMTVNRMMSAMRTADVMVVNPTHFAVALKYEASKGAPKVVAKGADYTATRMREVASECRVAVVSDPPLARTLYRACEINDEIPRVLFDAVAKLLAFVFALKKSGAPMMFGVTLTPPRPLLEKEITDIPRGRARALAAASAS
jgi:flagellar biosynthetic protein FlhB